MVEPHHGLRYLNFAMQTPAHEVLERFSYDVASSETVNLHAP